MTTNIRTRKSLLKAISRVGDGWFDIQDDINRDGKWDLFDPTFWSVDGDWFLARSSRKTIFGWFLDRDMIKVNIPNGMSAKTARRKINRLQRAWAKRFKHAGASRGH